MVHLRLRSPFWICGNVLFLRSCRSSREESIIMWRSPCKRGMWRKRRTHDHLNSIMFFQTLRLCSPRRRKCWSELHMGVMCSEANWRRCRWLSSPNSSSLVEALRCRVRSPRTKARIWSFPMIGLPEDKTSVISSSFGQQVPIWAKKGTQSPEVVKLSSSFVKYLSLERELVRIGSISMVNSQRSQFCTWRLLRFEQWSATKVMRSTECVVVLSAAERNSCEDSLSSVKESSKTHCKKRRKSGHISEDWTR